MNWRAKRPEERLRELVRIVVGLVCVFPLYSAAIFAIGWTQLREPGNGWQHLLPTDPFYVWIPATGVVMSAGLAGVGVAGGWALRRPHTPAGSVRLSLICTVVLGVAAIAVGGVAYLFAGYNLLPAMQLLLMFWFAIYLHLLIGRVVRARLPGQEAIPRAGRTRRAVVAGLAVTVVAGGAIPAVGHAFPAGPAGEASPVAAGTELVEALAASDRQRLLDVAVEEPPWASTDVAAEADDLLARLGGGRLVVTDIRSYELPATRSAPADGLGWVDLTGTLGGAPFCARVSVQRLDPTVLSFLERRKRGYGRWFVQPSAFRDLNQTSGSCPD